MIINDALAAGGKKRKWWTNAGKQINTMLPDMVGHRVAPGAIRENLHTTMGAYDTRHTGTERPFAILFAKAFKQVRFPGLNGSQG